MAVEVPSTGLEVQVRHCIEHTLGVTIVLFQSWVFNCICNKKNPKQQRIYLMNQPILRCCLHHHTKKTDLFLEVR